jgi:site-specific recombinase XerD
MKSFDEWFEKQNINLNCFDSDDEENWFISNVKSAFKAGQQSKQDEVDELKQKYQDLYDRKVKSNDENLTLKAHINELRCNRIISDIEINELQKRIDSVIEYLDGCDSCCDISKLQLIEVLQGDQS